MLQVPSLSCGRTIARSRGSVPGCVSVSTLPPFLQGHMLSAGPPSLPVFLPVASQPSFSESHLCPLRCKLAPFLLGPCTGPAGHMPKSLSKCLSGHTLGILCRTRFLLFCHANRLSTDRPAFTSRLPFAEHFLMRVIAVLSHFTFLRLKFTIKVSAGPDPSEGAGEEGSAPSRCLGLWPRSSDWHMAFSLCVSSLWFRGQDSPLSGPPELILGTI